MPQLGPGERFEAFVEQHEAPIRHALIAQLGGDAGREAASQALLYGLEQWDRVGSMSNPAGYLFRVGQRLGRRTRRRRVVLNVSQPAMEPWVEPELAAALGRLPEAQRVAVVLRHGDDLSYAEIAEFVGSSEAAARKNVERALRSLRRALKVEMSDV